MTRRYFVTGANGFIGRNLCTALQARGRVRALLRTPVSDGPWSESAVADLCEAAPPSGMLDGVDAVFHLAGRAHVLDEHVDDAGAYRRVNVDGTRRLYEAAGAAGVARFVLVSTVAVLGEGRRLPFREREVPRPVGAYGRTKLEAERIVRDGGLVPEPVVLRFPLVYGPGLKGNLRRMIDAVRAGRFPPVPRIANRRSMLHVDDAVQALVLAAEAPAAAGRVYTVTDGYAYSTRDVYEAICDALGKPPPPWTVPGFALRGLARVGDGISALTRRRWVFDSRAFEKLFGSAEYESRAIADELGYEPRWDLRRAMPDIVAGRPGQ